MMFAIRRRRRARRMRFARLAGLPVGVEVRGGAALVRVIRRLWARLVGDTWHGRDD